MTKRQARKLLIEFADTMKRFDAAMQDPKAKKVLDIEAQMLADDPKQDQYVQDMFQAYKRGKLAAKRGVSPGQMLDRELKKNGPYP